jgi:hypothetical protein
VKRISTAALVGAGALAVAGGAVAAGGSKSGAIQVSAKLSSAQEAPHPAVNVKSALGGFTATLTQTKKGYQMSWKISYQKLSGPATSAYIHEGKKAKFGPALFYLCSPCKPGAHGSAYASPSEVELILGGETYVNIRTKKNPSGEIRGQLAKAGG